ncbi:MAG TPA: Ig-like domain-containing protein [Acetivibrio sp.]|nr:Ig-like domain-containing protein [Acetivibrio sp.]
MKNLKKLLAVVVAIAMITTFMVPSFAAEGSYTYENEAEILYKLGLYKGTSTTTYEPNLGGKLDRQTGVVMLLRLFGQEEEALQMDAADAAAKLAAKFKDAADIADWAQRQVAYAVEKGYVKGLPDGTFAPTADLNGKAFCSLILQQLGYDGDFTYDNAAFDLSKFGGLTEAQAQLFNSNAGINRDSMVGIAFSALQAVYKDSGKTVIEYLAEIGYVDKNLAIEVGVLKKEIKEVGALEDVKVTINETPVLPTEVEVTYVDDTTAKLPVTWPTVNTSEVGEQTIEGSIEGYKDVKATVKVIVQPAELLVEKISMNNLIEIVIDFNGEVESGKADEKKNYSVDGKTIKSVSVSEDKTSVTLLLKDKAEQEEELEVTVKTAAGLTKDYTGKVTAIDNTLPEAKSIILTGPNSFEFKFSEPIDPSSAAAGDVIVDDGTYYVSSKELSADGKTLTVELGVSSLKEGTYKVKVRNYRDCANLIMVPKTFDLEYVKDTEAPTATVKKATQKEVEIEFNEPVVIDSSDLKNFFYHTYSSWKPRRVTTSDNKVFKLDFSNQYLQEGNVTITIVKEYDEVVIKDKWGNELQSDIKLTATVVADNEAPTVVKVEATAEDKIEITFSESVKADQAKNEDNYAIKKDGKEVDAAISDIKYVSEDNKVEITLSEKLSGGKYTIDVKDIADTSISENKIKAITLEFEVTDKTAPEVRDVTYVNQFVYVSYNEPMKTSGTGSVLNKDNYRIFKDDSTTAEISKIELFGSNKDKVKITVKKSESLDLSEYKLNVVRVEDEAGNAIDPFTITEWGLEEEKAPKVVAAKITSKTDIEITVDKILDRGTVQNGDFEVTKDGTPSKSEKLTKITSIEYDDGKTIIKGKLHSDVQPDNSGIGATYSLKIVGEVKSDTAQAMEEKEYDNSIFKDGWAPSLVENNPITVADNVYGVLITFTEELGDITEIAAADLVIVDKKGKTLVAGVDYKVERVTVGGEMSNNATNNAILVTLKDNYAEYTGQIKISTAEKVRYIKDEAGNTIETFKDKKVTVVAPTTGQSRKYY